jgi:hypothetical protein
LADGPNVTHLAGGVHATAEPVQTLDAGWDMAAIGEQRDLNDFLGFALRWDKFNALEITRGCIYACP